MRHEVIKMTPKRAAEWLSKPWQRQRHLSDMAVKGYAAAMRDGRWIEPTLDPIALTADGKLINGQHRLTAVIAADWSGEMLVAYDVDEALFPVIDTGRRRMAVQFVRTTSPQQVTTVARHVLWYDERWPVLPRGGSAFSFDNDVLLAYIDEHADALLTAVRDAEGPRRYSMVPISANGTVIYLARRAGADEGRIAGWVDGLTSGASLAADDPRLHLRNRLMTKTVIRHDRSAVWQLTVRAFNAWMQDRPLTKLVYDPDIDPPRIVLHETPGKRRARAAYVHDREVILASRQMVAVGR